MAQHDVTPDFARTNGQLTAERQSETRTTAGRKLTDAEILTRAREAYIASHRPWAFLARRVRRGAYDHKLLAVTRAIRDMQWPIEAIIAKEDEATAALAIKATPLISDLDIEHQVAVASAIITALRVQRRR